MIVSGILHPAHRYLKLSMWELHIVSELRLVLKGFLQKTSIYVSDVFIVIRSTIYYVEDFLVNLFQKQVHKMVSKMIEVIYSLIFVKL